MVLNTRPQMTILYAIFIDLHANFPRPKLYAAEMTIFNILFARQGIVA